LAVPCNPATGKQLAWVDWLQSELANEGRAQSEFTITPREPNAAASARAKEQTADTASDDSES
jgi:hypothetical protein